MLPGFQYASDLHLEFPQNRIYLQNNPLQNSGQVLLLAGDIVPFAVMDKHKAFFNDLSSRFEKVYWLPGNHEYYHFDAAKKAGGFCDQIRSNVFLVNNTSVVHGDTRLIFSTLWSSIHPDKQVYIEKSMSDFSLIRFNGFRFSIDRFNELHEQCMAYLQDTLAKPHQGKTIVVTHHVPTLMNYPLQYRFDDLNEAFAVELHDLIYAQGPHYWIYGHHHCNTTAFTIGRTQLLTNQLGYVQYGEHKGFRPDAIINL